VNVSCEKRRSLITAAATFYWSKFVTCSVFKKLKIKFMHTSNTENIQEGKSIYSHAQGTPALQANVFLTRMHGLLVINLYGLIYPLRHHFQGQSCSRESTTVSTTQLWKLPHTFAYQQHGLYGVPLPLSSPPSAFRIADA
jgi:hypothetical protein